MVSSGRVVYVRKFLKLIHLEYSSLWNTKLQVRRSNIYEYVYKSGLVHKEVMVSSSGCGLTVRLVWRADVSLCVIVIVIVVQLYPSRLISVIIL